MNLAKAAALLISGFVPLATAILPASAAAVTYDWTLASPAANLGGFNWTGSGTISVTTGSGSDTITEPPRVCRRLQLLRGWSHGQAAKAEVFT